MKNLIKLELRKNKIRTYVISSLVIMFISVLLSMLIGFLFKGGGASELGGANGPTYNLAFQLIMTLCLVMYGILGSVMSAKYVVEEYQGNRIYLTFSYPVSRAKLLASKLILIGTFIAISAIIALIINITLFTIASVCLGFINEPLVLNTFIGIVPTILVIILTSVAISMISMWVGFLTKSIPATIVTGVILCSILSNGSTGVSSIAMIALGIIMIIISCTVIYNLINRIEKLEV